MEYMESLRKEYLQGGTDGFGGRPAKTYKTTEMVAEKVGRGSKNSKVTP